jgi:hypothetical protein
MTIIPNASWFIIVLYTSLGIMRHLHRICRNYLYVRSSVLPLCSAPTFIISQQTFTTTCHGFAFSENISISQHKAIKLPNFWNYKREPLHIKYGSDITQSLKRRHKGTQRWHRNNICIGLYGVTVTLAWSSRANMHTLILTSFVLY